jgi:putative tryptophan/tyrosine transport system substrate-binding protein
MKRRNFIALVGSAAAWPLIGKTQQPAMKVIGFLNIGSPQERASLLGAFQQGLHESGFYEGQNVSIEYRWAEGHYDRLPALSDELVRLQASVIVATGSLLPAQAAKAATSKIPIIFEGGGDPVRLGLVTSLNRPGGNVTGVANIAGSLDPKRLQLLYELVPQAVVVGVLANPELLETLAKDMVAAASGIGRQVEIVYASSYSEIDGAFATLAQKRADALLVLADPMFMSHRDHIVALASRYAIPASYFFREFATAGGLMSYGVRLPDMYHQAGVYTGRILRGEKLSDLPVLEPSRFELVINLKTANALGLTVPPALLARADELIE